ARRVGMRRRGGGARQRGEAFLDLAVTALEDGEGVVEGGGRLRADAYQRHRLEAYCYWTVKASQSGLPSRMTSRRTVPPLPTALVKDASSFTGWSFTETMTSPRVRRPAAGPRASPETTARPAGLSSDSSCAISGVTLVSSRPSLPTVAWSPRLAPPRGSRSPLLKAVLSSGIAARVTFTSREAPWPLCTVRLTVLPA